MRMGPSMAWICPLQPAQNDRAFHRTALHARGQQQITFHPEPRLAFVSHQLTCHPIVATPLSHPIVPSPAQAPSTGHV